MAKPKLLVVLGAGSSLEQGMPSVAELDDWMRVWSEEWSALLARQNYFKELPIAANNYCRRGNPGAQHRASLVVPGDELMVVSSEDLPKLLPSSARFTQVTRRRTGEVEGATQRCEPQVWT